MASEEQMRLLFDSLDKDGDGRISAADIADVLDDPSRVEDIMQQLDTKGNRCLTYEEFSSGFESFLSASAVSEDMGPEIDMSEPTGGDNDVLQLFESLDVDGDGRLLLGDLTTILPDVDLDELQVLFTRLDSSLKGYLVFDNFKDGFDELMHFGRSHTVDDLAALAGQEVADDAVDYRRVEQDAMIHGDDSEDIKSPNSAAYANDDAALFRDGGGVVDPEEQAALIETLRSRLKHFKSVAKDVTKDYERLKGMMSAAEEEAESASKTATRLRDELAVARAALEDAQASRAEQTRVIGVLRRKLEQKTSETKELEDEEKTTLVELSSEKHRLEHMEDAMKEMKEHLDSLHQKEAAQHQDVIRSKMKGAVEKLIALHKDQELSRTQEELLAKVAELRQRNQELQDELDISQGVIREQDDFVQKLKGSHMSQSMESLADELRTDSDGDEEITDNADPRPPARDQGPANATKMLTHKLRVKNILGKVMTQRRQQKATQVKFFDVIQKARVKDMAVTIARQRRRIKELENQLRRLFDKYDREAASRLAGHKRKEDRVRLAGNIQLDEDSQVELASLARYMNGVLSANTEGLAHLLPIAADTPELLVKIRDGWLLARFLNLMVPGTLDERVLARIGTFPFPKDAHSLMLQNLQCVVECCKVLGIRMGQTRAQTLLDSHKKPLFVLDLLWRVVKQRLLRGIAVDRIPALAQLAHEDEQSVLLDHAELVRRWFDFHVSRSAAKPEIVEVLSNVSGPFGLQGGFSVSPHIHTSLSHLLLLHSLEPSVCPPALMKGILQQRDIAKRAETMLSMALQLQGIDEGNIFLTPAVIKGAGPVSDRLHLAFACSVIGAGHVGLGSSTDQADMKSSAESASEDRALAVWVDSMNKRLSLQTQHIGEQCRDGVLLLHILDFLLPGLVDWQNVDRKADSVAKRTKNAEYVLKLCRGDDGKLEGVRLPSGVSADAVAAGDSAACRELLWALMEKDIAENVKKSCRLLGQVISPDEDVHALLVGWVRERMSPELLTAEQKEAIEENLFEDTAFDTPVKALESLDQDSLRDSLQVLQLLWRVAPPDTVDWAEVSVDEDELDKLLNARYALSVARKMGAPVWIAAEDVLAGGPRVMVMYLAAILRLDAAARGNSGDSGNSASGGRQ